MSFCNCENNISELIEKEKFKIMDDFYLKIIRDIKSDNRISEQDKNIVCGIILFDFLEIRGVENGK